MIKSVCVNRARIQVVTLLLLTTIFISNCTKIDITQVGSGLIPGVDNIHTFDTTFSIIANNYDEITECDSIASNDLLASGIISDNPLFGRSRGEIYFEMKPTAFPAALPAHDTLTMVVDSVVLVLKYSHSYGDTNTMQKVTVHDLTDNFKIDSVYKTCDRISYNPAVIAEKTFTPASLKDSIHAFKEDAASQLRIRLDNSFGEDYIANISKFTSDSAFRLYHKGFAVIPDDAIGGDALNYFDLNSESSRISIYVRSKRDTVLDTSAIALRLTPSSVQANYLERDRLSSEMTGYLNEDPQGDSLLFLQAYPSGSYAILKVPALNGFPNSVINRAELVVEQVYDPAAGQYRPPRFLYLDVKDSSGRYIPIPCDFSQNQLQTGFPYLGGTVKTITNSSGQKVAQYTFNLSRYVQSLVTKGAENTSIRLRAPFSVVNSKSYLDRCGQAISSFYLPVNSVANGGVKLNGTNGTESSIRMHVIYSKL